MAEDIPTAFAVELSRKWRVLAERRKAHLVDLYDSGRWRLYYSEKNFVMQLREAIGSVEKWSATEQSAQLEALAQSFDVIMAGDDSHCDHANGCEWAPAVDAANRADSDVQDDEPAEPTEAANGMQFCHANGGESAPSVDGTGCAKSPEGDGEPGEPTKAANGMQLCHANGCESALSVNAASCAKSHDGGVEPGEPTAAVNGVPFARPRETTSSGKMINGVHFDKTGDEAISLEEILSPDHFPAKWATVRR